MTTYEISKDEAVTLVRKHAWERREYDGSTCGHRGCEDHPATTTVIHTTLGGFGADWSLDAALETIQTAQSIQWGWNLLQHDMVVIQADGNPVQFEVKAPDVVRQQLIAEARSEAPERSA